jgi:hypothetical protein
MKMPQSTGTRPEMMKKSEAVSLRFYSSPSFPAITIPLRDPDRTTKHPLVDITYCIFTGIKKQLTLGARDKKAVSELIIWRGFSDLQISANFQENGGSEYVPCPPVLIPQCRWSVLFVSLRRTELSSCASSPRTTLKGVFLSFLVPHILPSLCVHFL